jgi:hypothetical protein
MDIYFVAQRVKDGLDPLHRKLAARLGVFVFAQGALRHPCADRQLLLTDAAFFAKLAKQLGPVRG